MLCNLLNELEPGKIAKISNKRMAFMQMENIAAFCEGAKSMGVPDRECFVTVDLHQGKDMRQVYLCIVSLKRATGHGMDKTNPNEGGGDVDDLLVRDSAGSAPPPSSSSNPSASAVGADPSALREDEEDFNREKDVSRLGGARRAGQLDADLRDRGVVSICPKCNLPVSSGAVYALDETWHPKCFTCKKCDKKLGATTFYEHEDKAYCDICILRVK